MSLEAFQQRRADIAYQFLNDLSSRRRVTRFFPNQQSPLYGAQDGFLNTSRGNVTFLVRDLVRVAAMPIVIARVYDSSSETGDFGQGWSLGTAERIEMRQGQPILIDASNATYELDRQGQEITARFPAITPVDEGSFEGDRITLRTGGLVREFERNGRDFRIVSARNDQGGSVQITYAGDRISRIESGNAFVELQRDGQGRITAAVDDLGRSVLYSYEQGNLVGVQDLGGESWLMTYTNALTTVVDPRGSTVFEAAYDGAGRASSVRVMRTEVTATYAGTTTELLDGLGRTTRFERDQSGLTTAVTDAQGYRTSLMLDDDLRPTEVRADGQFAARLHYDAQGRVQQVQASDAIYDYRHDQQGRLVSRSTDGAVTTFTYNGLSGRVSDIVSPDRVVQYGYDAQARLDTVSDGDTELAIQSDAAGLIQAVNRDGERLLSYTYTGNGVPATIRHGDNVATANQTFDERGFSDIDPIRGRGLRCHVTDRIRRYRQPDRDQCAVRKERSRRVARL